jgi:hypothetical protein
MAEGAAGSEVRVGRSSMRFVLRFYIELWRVSGLWAYALTTVSEAIVVSALTYLLTSFLGDIGGVCVLEEEAGSSSTLRVWHSKSWRYVIY